MFPSSGFVLLWADIEARWFLGLEVLFAHLVLVAHQCKVIRVTLCGSGACLHKLRVRDKLLSLLLSWAPLPVPNPLLNC